MQPLPYTVRISENDGTFELRIPELCIVARGSDLSATYAALRRRADELVDWSTHIGQIELPPPDKVM
jgi:non-ribosomal peptide synthetase component F